MAYDVAVMFTCLKSIKDSTKITYRFNNCDWGWLISDKELTSKKDNGEIEYEKTLSPLEIIKRYESKKIKVNKSQKNKLLTLKNIYKQYKELSILSMYLKQREEINFFNQLIYDKRLINVTFEKFWWESGLN